MVVLPGSPATVVQEVDLTSVVPSISGTTTGAAVGALRWGPANVRMQFANESQLRQVGLTPDSNTYLDFLSAANFLSYGNDLRFVRVVGNNANNATQAGTGVKIENEAVWDNTYSSGSATYGPWAARSPGGEGNSLLVSVCPSSNAWNKTLVATANTTNGSNLIIFNANTLGQLAVNDVLTIGALGNVYITALSANGFEATVNTTITSNVTAGAVVASWAWAPYFSGPPGTSSYAASVAGASDEMHVIVVDAGGVFSSPPVGSGGANTVLEIYPFVSKASDARNNDGTPNYVKEVIRNKSPYIYWMNNLAGGTNWGTPAAGVTFTTVLQNQYSRLTAGQTDVPTDSNRQAGWSLFTDPDVVDISLIIGGSTSSTLATYLISNVAEVYKYAVLFLSPRQSDVVGVPGSELTNVTSWASTLPASDRTFVDTNWKYMLDRYNNVFRWVPCNPDTAGTCVRTDSNNDPWYSPAGFTRGGIKNVVKLAWNPSQTQRNTLYALGLNPIVNFQGQGPVLFGDKTFVTKPSAFSRINVRRLFIVLEKAISNASKFSMFEFNDEFTRSSFVNLITPFLNDVKGRRGITDFKVVCDETNNTPSVIQSGQFVGTILIKPNYSINWVVLSFVAVNNQVSFDTIPAQF
jgi:hypothetical protein